MLTDYHTHLRPDDLEASADRYYTRENVERYCEAAAARGIDELGFSEHVYRFREALDVWRHPFWEEQAVDDLDGYVEAVLEARDTGLAVKLGIEMDWIDGREEQIAALLDGRPFDYVIGSVHFISDRAVDHEGYDAWRVAHPDEVWESYFCALGSAAASELFDVMAHPDLVKVWGQGRPAPSRDRREFYELALERAGGADVAFEVSTAGLRKPVGEIYPSAELLEMLLEAGKPLSLSSDAHAPEHIGHGYGEALELLRGAGVSEVSVFEGRRRRMEPLG